MSNANETLRSNYREELEALRYEGREFALNHPDVARELGIGNGSWNDPQAEMLVQSFAFLTARIRKQMEVDRSAVPNALLNHLYPQLQAPVPCMSIVQAEVATQSADGRPIERGRVFSSEAVSNKRKILCRFRNCYETPIWPLSVEQVESVPIKAVDFLGQESDVSGIIRVSLRTGSKDPIQELPLASSGLRFHIAGARETAGHLYELLSTALKAIAIHIPGRPEPQFLPVEKLSWRGFDDNEAALPDSAQSNPGYRLIREYFAFPQKFMFFDLEGIDTLGADREMSIYFLFDDPVGAHAKLDRNALRLNCFPVVNLFEQSIEPIRLTGRKYEYPLEADRLNIANFEIYQILSLQSIVNGEAPQPIAPCYELSNFNAEEEAEYFYTHRRELSETERIPGTRSYISLLDLNMDVCEVPAEAIGGMALCTNRRLPEKLQARAMLSLEGAGPVSGARLIGKMSEYSVPQLAGNAPWQLVSQLSLNFLSIAGGDQGLEAFKSILRVYTDARNLLVWKQINSLKSISARRVARLVRDSESAGVGQGLQIRLKINETDFKGISPVLFASVCRYFFALYASLGTFVELVLESNKDRGDWKIWPPMAGALVDL